MSGTLRRLRIALAAPIALASLSAMSHADRVEYKYLYKNSTYTTTVGVAYQFCDGDYILQSGYETPYIVVGQYFPCP
jgi:hypothetical protein